MPSDMLESNSSKMPCHGNIPEQLTLMVDYEDQICSILLANEIK